MNTAFMLEMLRDNVFEATEAMHTDEHLLMRLNQGQGRVALRVSMCRGDWLVASADLTPVASVITLPSDCSKPIYLEEKSSGTPLTWLDGGVAHRRVSRAVGTSIDTAGTREVYPLMSTIEVNQDSYSTEVTLWYQIRVPDLHTGDCGASSGASALEFAQDKNLVFLVDYYNNSVIEMLDSGGAFVALRSTISDFAISATEALATITGTGVSGQVYGTISRLPEETHPLIILEATVSALLKVSANVDKQELDRFRSERNQERKVVDEWLESRIVGPSGVAIGGSW